MRSHSFMSDFIFHTAIELRQQYILASCVNITAFVSASVHQMFDGILSLSKAL